MAAGRVMRKHRPPPCLDAGLTLHMRWPLCGLSASTARPAGPASRRLIYVNWHTSRSSRAITTGPHKSRSHTLGKEDGPPRDSRHKRPTAELVAVTVRPGARQQRRVVARAEHVPVPLPITETSAALSAARECIVTAHDTGPDAESQQRAGTMRVPGSGAYGLETRWAS